MVSLFIVWSAIVVDVLAFVRTRFGFAALLGIREPVVVAVVAATTAALIVR